MYNRYMKRAIDLLAALVIGAMVLLSITIKWSGKKTS